MSINKQNVQLQERDLIAENERLHWRIEELERVLRMVEFGGEWDVQWCMWCHQQSNTNRPDDVKHKPDCPRQKALRE